MTHQFICLERSNENPRWLSTLEYQHQLHVVESSRYASPGAGYAMKFANESEFRQWLADQIALGWNITYHLDQPPLALDEHTLNHLKFRAFDYLKG